MTPMLRRVIFTLLMMVLVPCAAWASPTSELLDAVQASRQKVTALIAVDNESVQTSLLNEIAVITQDVNARADALLADEQTPDDIKSKVSEFKMIWDQLVLTRDNDMIPAILAGEKDKAKSIGQDVQAERFKKIAGLLK